MRTNDPKRSGSRVNVQRSRFGDRREAAETLGFSEASLGQSEPEHCPRLDSSEFSLGDALNINEVAAVLGCSTWTVRQKYLPQGLPCLRTSTTGKFVFFRRQVLDWILERQRKEEWK